MVATVLMAVYDTPLDMLEQALNSILQQSFRDFEFLIVDDGSRDGELRSFLTRQAEEDARIRIAWEPHRGLTPSLNRGIGLARGEFIARQDADDWSEPVRLERQVAFLREHSEVALCGSAAWTHQQDGRALWCVAMPRTHAEILHRFPRGNPFVHGSVMFRTEAALAAGGYREAFPCSQDYDFFWRLTEADGAANLPEPLYHYRYTCGSVSAGRAAEQARAHSAIRILAGARSRGECEDVARALEQAGDEMASRGQHRAALKQADHLMLAGDYRAAWLAYRSLLDVHPTSPLAWGKLLRWGLFRTIPSLREASFR